MFVKLVEQEKEREADDDAENQTGKNEDAEDDAQRLQRLTMVAQGAPPET